MHLLIFSWCPLSVEYHFHFPVSLHYECYSPLKCANLFEQHNYSFLYIQKIFHIHLFNTHNIVLCLFYVFFYFHQLWKPWNKNMYLIFFLFLQGFIIWPQIKYFDTPPSKELVYIPFPWVWAVLYDSLLTNRVW